MSYSINWLENGVCVKAEGIYTLEDNLKANGELYGDARFGDLKFQIGDFTDADISEYTLKTANIIGKMESVSTVWNNNLRVAHVTKDQEFIKIIKTYEESLINSNWVFEIFDNYEDAFEWCNK
jgi:hypothetical protein